MAEESDSVSKFFDRYEVVAITLPGAAMLFALGYLVVPIEKLPVNISLGSLGLFAVAALATGHVVQALAHFAEKIAERTIFSTQVTVYRSLDIESVALQEYAIKKSSAHKIRDRVAAERRQALVALRRLRRAQLIDTLKVDSGFNRGMCVVAFIILVLVAALSSAEHWKNHSHTVMAALAAMTCVVCGFRYRQYESDREYQIWNTVLDTKQKASPA